MTDKDPLICDLKARRLALGWSVTELSQRCGIDEKFLSDWERGLGSPRLDAARRWGAALGMRLALVSAAGQARDGLRIDWDKRCITVDGTPVRLTPMEWKGLERLAWTPGELVSHRALFRHLYGDGEPYRAQSTAIRVLVTKLRRLLPLRIEARWGQGYVVSGIESSLARRDGADNASNDDCLAPQPVTAMPQSLHLSLAAEAAPRDALTMRPEVIDLSEPGMRRAAASPPRLALCRADELGVIERFLAERGVTRCPDTATIQQSPLPTLVWDKVKRKWVRPSLGGQEAS